MPLSNAEIDAVISVLWHTHAIRRYCEDQALSDDEFMWKKNGGLFSNFARYNSQKWQDMMGPDDPTVRGRKISRASMARQQGDFRESYRAPIMFALDLVDRIRGAVAEAIDRNGPSKDGDYEEEIGRKAWAEIVSDPAVQKEFMKISKSWSNAEPSPLQL